ncbi:hypothetical protein GCM10027088_13680 [Nocardia goodfellowii]|uniref:Uncharacterized protein n=1 Tax=Nocardia goodfellowii TaxID=882446 RepID=A0ABS4QDS0_9NOCA|nr:hypothetical protein [Nocardia goodfellowii]
MSYFKSYKKRAHLVWRATMIRGRVLRLYSQRVFHHWTGDCANDSPQAVDTPYGRIATVSDVTGARFNLGGDAA